MATNQQRERLRRLARNQPDNQRLQRMMKANQSKLRALQRKSEKLKKEISRAARQIATMLDEETIAELEASVEKDINKAGWMEEIVGQRFVTATEHGPGSSKWAKRKREVPWPILIKSGRLMKKAQRAVKGTFKINTPMRWSTDDIDLPYANVHQYGFGAIAARPYLDLPNEKEMKPVKAEVRRLMREKIRKILAKRRRG